MGGGLSPVNLAAHFVAAYTESQLGADPSGPNRVFNCVPASVALVLQALGFPYIHPQALEDLVYGAGHHGGSDFAYFMLRLHALGRWPGLPEMSLTDTSATDTVTFIHAAIAQGFPVICDFKDNANAQLVPQWDASWHGTHASVAVAVDASTISIINVWTGVLQTFSHAVFAQATTSPAGNVWVFKRDIRTSLGGTSLTPGLKNAIVQLAYAAGCGRTAENATVLHGWSGSMADDDATVEDAITRMLTGVEAQKRFAALRVLCALVDDAGVLHLPAGPQGPQGLKGDAGAAGTVPSGAEIVKALSDAIKP